MDQRTDTPSYRDARTHLKIVAPLDLVRKRDKELKRLTIMRDVYIISKQHVHQQDCKTFLYQVRLGLSSHFFFFFQVIFFSGKMRKPIIRPGKKTGTKDCYHRCSYENYEYHERYCSATKPRSTNVSFRCKTRSCRGGLLIKRGTDQIISNFLYLSYLICPFIRPSIFRTVH